MLARRSILTGSLAAGLVPALGSLAKAQVPDRSRDVIQALAAAKGQAENLLAGALYAKLAPESAAAVESANERLFADIAAVVGGIPPEEATLYAEPGQTLIAEQMVERGVPVVPQAATPIAAGAASATASDELTAIVGDILKGAFGVADLDAAKLTEVAAQLSLSPILSRIGGLIRTDNLPLAAEFIRALLTQLAASPQTIPALETALGQQTVKEVLAGAAARYAVFVGWPVLVVSILFAVSKQRARLDAAIQKAGL